MNSRSCPTVESDPTHRTRASCRPALAHSALTRGWACGHVLAGDTDTWASAPSARTLGRGGWGTPWKAPPTAPGTGWWPGQIPALLNLRPLSPMCRCCLSWGLSPERGKQGRAARLVRGRAWLDCVCFQPAKPRCSETNLTKHSVPREETPASDPRACGRRSSHGERVHAGQRVCVVFFPPAFFPCILFERLRAIWFRAKKQLSWNSTRS